MALATIMKNSFKLKNKKVVFKGDFNSKITTVKGATDLAKVLNKVFKDHKPGVNIFSVVNMLKDTIAEDFFKEGVKTPVEIGTIAFQGKSVKVFEDDTLGSVLHRFGPIAAELLKNYYAGYFKQEFLEAFENFEKSFNLELGLDKL